jgi:hypothetical protein
VDIQTIFDELAATEETPLPRQTSGVGSIPAGAADRFYGKPCSACGDGDVEMKYHTHPPTPMRAERALPAQWENIADAKPSSFEYTTRDDAFRYCAQQLRNALAMTENKPTVCPEETPLVGPHEAETGWLIERRMQLPPEYLYVPDWSGFQWTQDSLKALRFSRREDAEQVAHIFENDDVYITEHQWG